MSQYIQPDPTTLPQGCTDTQVESETHSVLKMDETPAEHRGERERERRGFPTSPVDHWV